MSDQRLIIVTKNVSLKSNRGKKRKSWKYVGIIKNLVNGNKKLDQRKMKSF